MTYFKFAPRIAAFLTVLLLTSLFPPAIFAVEPHEDEVKEQFVYDFTKAGFDDVIGEPEGFELLGRPANQTPRVVRYEYSLSLQTNTSSEVARTRSFALPVEQSGTYKIKFLGSLGPSGGPGEIKINDTLVGVYDFYSSASVRGEMKEMDVPIHLKAGTHEVTFRGVADKWASYMYVSELILEKMPSQLAFIDLTAERTMLFPNESIQLELSGELSDESPADLGDATIQFESSNEDILTVNDSGEVTALSEGTATIFATVLLNGVEQQSSIELDVVAEIVEDRFVYDFTKAGFDDVAGEPEGFVLLANQRIRRQESCVMNTVCLCRQIHRVKPQECVHSHCL